MEIINFVTDLDNAYKRNRTTWEELQTALANNAKEREAVCAKRVISENERVTVYATGTPDGLITESARRAELERLDAKAADLKEQLANLQASASAEYQTIKGNMTAKLAAELEADPASVDINGYSLITSHIMSDGDLLALARKYRENPTMLKIIEPEAGNRKGGEMAVLCVAIKNFLDPHDRTENFDRAIEEVTRSLNPNFDYGNINADYWTTKGLARIREEISGADALNV